MEYRCFWVPSYELVPAPIRKWIHDADACTLHLRLHRKCAVRIRRDEITLEQVLRVMELLNVLGRTCPARGKGKCIGWRKHVHSTAINPPDFGHNAESAQRDH